MVEVLAPAGEASPGIFVFSVVALGLAIAAYALWWTR
jgi:hypothetical protein